MGLSNAERQARWRAKRDAEVAALKAKPAADVVAALKAELAQARARIQQMAVDYEKLLITFKELGKEALDMAAELAAKPKTERPALPPEEARDRKIAAQATEVKNLKAKLRHLQRAFDDGVAMAGGMNFATQSAIARCLHPDHTPSETQPDEACRLFTAWKADKDKAARRAPPAS